MKVYKVDVIWYRKGETSFFFTEEDIEKGDSPEEAAKELFSLMDHVTLEEDLEFEEFNVREV